MSSPELRKIHSRYRAGNFRRPSDSYDGPDSVEIEATRDASSVDHSAADADDGDTATPIVSASATETTNAPASVAPAATPLAASQISTALARPVQNPFDIPSHLINLEI